MRYSCEDIKYYLDHNNENPEDRQEFLNHIENCPRCGEMINPDPELEELLFSSFSRNALPESLAENILARIMEYEKDFGKEKRLEKIFLPIVGFISALPIFLAVWFWKDIRTYFTSHDLAHTFDSLRSYIREIRIPEIDLAGIIGAISNSPLIILSLISITALVWAFSIIEAQKSLK